MLIGVVLSLGFAYFASQGLSRSFQPPGVGSTAPDFEAYDLEGDPVRFRDLKGEVILLNIWATWCPPCREEMPSMQRLYEAFSEDGLRILAVSIDGENIPGTLGPGNSADPVEAFIAESGIQFSVWRDPDRTVQSAYRAYMVPESYVIDKTGLIVARVIGPTEWDAPHRMELFRRLLSVD